MKTILTESDLMNLVKESVKRVLKEMSDAEKKSKSKKALQEQRIRKAVSTAVDKVINESNFPFLDKEETARRLFHKSNGTLDSARSEIFYNRAKGVGVGKDGLSTTIRELAKYCKISYEDAVVLYNIANSGDELYFSKGPFEKYSNSNFTISRIGKAYNILRAYFSKNATYGRDENDKTKWTIKDNDK